MEQERQYKEVMQIIKESDKPLTSEQIIARLKGQKSSVMRTLKMLEAGYKIEKGKNNRYRAVETDYTRVGRLTIDAKGFGILKTDNGEIVRIPKQSLNGCFEGDIVLTRVKRIEEQVFLGRVETCLEKKEQELFGEIIQKGEFYYVIPDESRYAIEVRLGKVTRFPNLKVGMKVLFQVIDFVDQQYHKGYVTQVLGTKEDPNMEILSFLKEFQIPNQFCDEAEKEAQQIPDKVMEKDCLGREDYRKWMIFTIDGEDTKDIDDAVSLRLLENGNYELGIHIADVSHYVKEGSAIDLDAKGRGTSCYFLNMVIPMLPRQLSNGICSLNELEDRLAFSCLMEYTKDGIFVSSKLTESVIHSQKKMEYHKVNEVLEGHSLSDYIPFQSSLCEMNQFAERLRKRRIERGNIDLDLPEIKLILDQNGNPLDLALRDRGKAERMIEEFMIAANEATARIDVPLLYRVHKAPDQGKYDQLVNTLGHIGYQLEKAETREDMGREINKLLVEVRKTEASSALIFLILKSLQRAFYSPINLGHFALASTDYIHFTSPIRRYADLQNHRQLKRKLKQPNYVLTPQEKVLFASLGGHLSSRQTIVMDCEREIEKTACIRYLNNHIGEEFEGHICHLNPQWISVLLPNMVEGKIKIEDLGTDLVFDKRTFQFTSLSTDLIYRIGMPLKVQVAESAKKERIIRFVPAKVLIKKGDYNG